MSHTTNKPDWHTLLSIVMDKLEVKELIFTAEDLNKYSALSASEFPCAVYHERVDGIHIMKMNIVEAYNYKAMVTMDTEKTTKQ